VRNDRAYEDAEWIWVVKSCVAQALGACALSTLGAHVGGSLHSSLAVGKGTKTKLLFSAEKLEETTETEADDGSSWPTKKVESRQFFEIFQFFSSNCLHCPSLVRMCESFALVTHHFVNLSFSQKTNVVFYKGKGAELGNKMAARGCIFSHVQPFYERVVSDLDRPMHRSLWV